MRKHSRKEQERLNRRTWILDSSEELMRQHGVTRVGMEQIAQHAECAKGTLYQHFTSKEHIILALAERDLATQLASIARATDGIASPLSRVFAVFETLLSHRQKAAISYTHHVQALLEDDRDEHKLDPATRGSLERLRQGIDSTLRAMVHEAYVLGEIKRDIAHENDLCEALLALVDLAQSAPVRQHQASTQPIWTLLTQVFTGEPWAPAEVASNCAIAGVRATAQANLHPKRTTLPEHEPAL